MPSWLRKEGSTFLLISLDILLRLHQKPLQYEKIFTPLVAKISKENRSFQLIWNYFVSVVKPE